MEKKVQEFLGLPPEALHGADFTDAGGSWAHSAWDVLRQIARTGETAASACGSSIRVRADRDGWRDGIIIP